MTKKVPLLEKKLDILKEIGIKFRDFENEEFVSVSDLIQAIKEYERRWKIEFDKYDKLGNVYSDGFCAAMMLMIDDFKEIFGEEK